MRLESRSQPPEAGGKQKSRNGHQEASIHEKTSYEAVKIDNPLEPFDKTRYPMPPGYFEFLNIQEALLKAYGSPEEPTDA